MTVACNVRVRTNHSGASGFQMLAGAGSVSGYDFSSTMAFKSGCYMLAGTTVDKSGASNDELGRCL